MFGSWPPIGWEERTWVPSVPPDLVSRRVRERHTGPYRAAVVPPIANLKVELPASVLAQADAASIEIARFDAELGAEVAPFSALLLRSESASSSRIENLTSGARAIALAEIEQGGGSNAIQIVRNVHAMQAAIALADRLDGHAILAMHEALLAHDIRQETGHWRLQQVWIGGGDHGPHLADFVPPHHQRVPAAMDDLIAFIRRDDIPVLAQAALAHAQFETIHPFADGNGRTGRAIIHSILRGRGLTRNVTVPVSAGLLTDTPLYFAALTRYRTGDAAEIVRLAAEASLRALTNARQLVGDLEEIRERWTTVISARRDALAWRLADLVARQPVIDAATVQCELGATSANTYRALGQLTEARVIVEFTGKARERLWQSPEVLSALDDFAARVGRRIP